LPGIGSKLASRIVNFRDKLGGFCSIEQVGETYALPDSTFQKIRPRLLMSNGPFRFININSAKAEDIKAHPYVKWNEANAIVQFRTQHGMYTAVDDLLKIAIISTEWLQKMKPYLKLD
jgi:competence protein ComEA